jgi:hypothetical protein
VDSNGRQVEMKIANAESVFGPSMAQALMSAIKASRTQQQQQNLDQFVKSLDALKQAKAPFREVESW